MYIYMRKPESYRGIENVHHVHITQSPSKSKDWGENSPSIIKKLEIEEQEMILFNVQIVDVEYRDKGGEAFQTVADIKVDGVVYTIRFDLRVYHIMDLISTIGIGEKGNFDKYQFYYNGGIVPIVDGNPNYESLKQHFAALEAKKASKDIRNRAKITKSNVKEFTIYKDEYGSEMYILGVVSLKNDSKRYYLSLDLDGVSITDFSEDSIIDLLLKNKYKLSEKLTLTEEVSTFLTNLRLVTFLEKYNKSLYKERKFTSEQVSDIVNNFNYGILDKYDYTDLGLVNFENLISSVMNEGIYQSILTSVKSKGSVESAFGKLFDLYEKEITTILKNWNYKKPTENDYTEINGYYVTSIENFLGVTISMYLDWLSCFELFFKNSDSENYIVEIDLKVFMKGIRNFLVSLEFTTLYNVDENSTIYGIALSHDCVFAKIYTAGDYHSSSKSCDKFTYSKLNYKEFLSL